MSCVVILIVLAIIGMNEAPIDCLCRFAQVTCSAKNVESCVYWFGRTGEIPTLVQKPWSLSSIHVICFNLAVTIVVVSKENMAMLWLPRNAYLLTIYHHVSSVACEDTNASGSGLVQAQSATYTDGSRITLDLKLSLLHGPSKLVLNQLFYSHSILSIVVVYSNSRAIHDRTCYGVFCPIITSPLAETLSKQLCKMLELWNESILLVSSIHSDGRNGMRSLICCFKSGMD